MSKNKTILAVILLLALIPLTANATITRVVGLGGEGANYIIKDAFNPNIWPQLVRDYPSLAGAEFWTHGVTWDFYKAYVNYDFGEDKCVLAVSLDKEPGCRYDNSPDFPAATAGPYNRLSVALGRPMGDLLVGVGINYTGKSYKSDAVTGPPAVPAYDISYATYGIRLGATALEKKLDLALGIEIASFSKDSAGTTTVDNDGSMSFAFDGRYWYTVNDRYSLIPNAKFAMMKDAAKMGDHNGDALTTTTFGVGIGNNWTPVENMLAIFELGVMSTSTKSEPMVNDVTTETTDSQMDIYWRLGFESKIFSWLDGRLGAERAWRSLSYESMPGKPEIGTNSTATYLGATAHWNRLWLDLLIAEAFMQHGPYFLSGVGGQTFSRVSLKYDFNQ